MIGLKTEEKMADVHQAYETFALVVSQALGGKPSSGPVEAPASAYAKDADDLEARLNRKLSGG